MYLAKAYFKMKKFKECKSLLTSLIMRYPQDLRIKLNLALCFWAKACDVLNLPNRKVVETEEAIANLKHAGQIFT